jgi:hypothetical protein
MTPGGMSPEQIVTLIASFLGGFGMTWLRGFTWFNDGGTNVVALLGGILATYLIGASAPSDWVFGIMAHTLTIYGAVHVGGNLAKMRAKSDLPAAVMPQYNELSKP